MSDFVLPPRGIIRSTDSDDPLPYYYWPVVVYFYRTRLQRMLKMIPATRYPATLEVAYGSGILLPSLAPMSDELHGIDLHDRIDDVAAMLQSLDICAELVTGDALNMPYENARFDCVVNASMLEHLMDSGAAIDEMLRVLKPGGILALGFPARNPGMDFFFACSGSIRARFIPLRTLILSGQLLSAV